MNDRVTAQEPSRGFSRNPRIYAHRGFSARFPENTALAFREALDSGADGIECDLQRLDDGTYVILHDATLDRTSNATGAAFPLPLSRLKELDFGRGERILTLEELLAFLRPNHLLNLELKKESIRTEHAPEIIQILRTAERNAGNTQVSSFQHDLLPSYRRAGFDTGMLIGEEHQGVSPLAYVKWIFKIRPTSVNLPVQAFDRVPLSRLRILFRVFRILGCKLYFWTVNTREQLQQLRPWADAIITDEVVLIRDFL